MSTLNCEELPSLTYLDLTNHRVLSSLNIANNGLLQDLYLKGTDALKNLKLPETTTLRNIELGKSLNTLTMKGLTGVETIVIEAADKFENIYVENCSRVISSESYNWVASSVSSGALQSCTVLGAYWDRVNVNVLENLLNLGDKLVLTGYMKINAKISYELKTRLMTKFGSIDNPNNSLYVEYIEEELREASLPKRLYLYELGDHQMTFIPVPTNGNTFVKTEWWLEAGASLYASINPDTGVISISKIGHEIEDPAEYSYGVRITLKDGEVLEAEGRICFYQRSCRLGDYVFNDGTYSDELMGNKIPVGICFYIDPRNPENRLMVAMRNLTTATNAWGLMSNWIGDSDFGGLDNVVLEGDPEYNCYNIEGIDDISLFGSVIKIDHHPFVEKFGEIEYIDDSASSTSQLIFKIVLDMKLKISKKIAENIYIGIIGDTDRFLHDYTTNDTMRLVSKLLDMSNIEFTKLYEPLYSRPLSEVRFQGYIYQNLILTENKVAYIKLTDDILKKYQVDSAAAGNMINDLKRRIKP